MRRTAEEREGVVDNTKRAEQWGCVIMHNDSSSAKKRDESSADAISQTGRTGERGEVDRFELCRGGGEDGVKSHSA